MYVNDECDVHILSLFSDLFNRFKLLCEKKGGKKLKVI